MGWLDFREPVSAWSHFVWMLLAVPGTLYLWRRSRGDRVKQVSLLVYGLSLTACFAGSSLFHGARSPELVPTFRQLDHVGIYLLIAGSYTPTVVVLLRGSWRWSILAMSWLLAAGGIALRLAVPHLPVETSTGYYLMMGWAAVLCYVELARALSHRAMRPIVAGGMLYSVGAFINLARWPALVPGVFGPHEIMHFFVMAGSLVHYRFMLTAVVPFRRAPFRGRPPVVVTRPGEDVYYPLAG